MLNGGVWRIILGWVSVREDGLVKEGSWGLGLTQVTYEKPQIIGVKLPLTVVVYAVRGFEQLLPREELICPRLACKSVHTRLRPLVQSQLTSAFQIPIVAPSHVPEKLEPWPALIRGYNSATWSAVRKPVVIWRAVLRLASSSNKVWSSRVTYNKIVPSRIDGEKSSVTSHPNFSTTSSNGSLKSSSYWPLLLPLNSDWLIAAPASYAKIEWLLRPWQTSGGGLLSEFLIGWHCDRREKKNDRLNRGFGGR